MPTSLPGGITSIGDLTSPSTNEREVAPVLRAKKGQQVEIKRGRDSGLSGTVVGKTIMGNPKIQLDDGATKRGDSVVNVNKKKLKKKK
jgi:hypothetical protein